MLAQLVTRDPVTVTAEGAYIDCQSDCHRMQQRR